MEEAWDLIDELFGHRRVRDSHTEAWSVTLGSDCPKRDHPGESFKPRGEIATLAWGPSFRREIAVPACRAIAHQRVEPPFRPILTSIGREGIVPNNRKEQRLIDGPNSQRSRRVRAFQ